MIRRPPRSTLFPTRRSSDLARGVRHKAKSDFGLAVTGIAGPGGGTEEKPVGLVYIALRSEEHTSELQSRSDLVCRLLLEKKNSPNTHGKYHVPAPSSRATTP